MPCQPQPRAHRRRLVTTAALLAAATALSLPAQAHGPTRQKVVETISIAAPAAKVWARIAAFDGLKNWHPAVAESPADQGNAEGSVRHLRLKGGGELFEKLEGYSAEQMKYSYRARDGGALPVTNYTATLQVRPDGEGRSTVEWRGAFYRGHPNNDPPPDRNDEAAVRAVTAVYQAGLAQLKKLTEAP
ncbi:SRPBCC family protein [Aquabacterium sp. OR-4]|uniref:SRPBCC family protein n=1 Tax=Aquabacterium sp. OR-4 TaxID=2978127 RepID=UPI0021B2903B|nr:SRPBCC family protein [Aquabacterium sp. OR-4]MDT7838303.1 SRPBCC family protein [Aquabacterium sp. OR-4]